MVMNDFKLSEQFWLALSNKIKPIETIRKIHETQAGITKAR